MRFYPEEKTGGPLKDFQLVTDILRSEPRSPAQWRWEGKQGQAGAKPDKRMPEGKVGRKPQCGRPLIPWWLVEQRQKKIVWWPSSREGTVCWPRAESPGNRAGICSGCCHRKPRAGVLINTHVFLLVLGAGRPRPRCQQGWLLPGPLCSACRSPLLCVCARPCVQTACSYKDSSRIGGGPTLRASF